MRETLLPGLFALMGALIGSFATYWFGLRQDKVTRRRERIIAHLIEAYRNLEDAAGRQPLSEERKHKIETSLAAIFLLGSKDAASQAQKLAEDISNGVGNMLPLLKQMRRDLRAELGLEQHDVEIKFTRMESVRSSVYD